jgi:hypothetical protein
MQEQLHIPAKLKVGMQKRSDTYSGILGFITYEMPDGLNKHKKSWDNWRDDSLGIKEFDNSPTEGFVFNKREGGGGRWSYDEREAKIRVWDPRGFEFEITIENMLDILAQCGSYPGKGLEGEFVYGYDNLRLSLIPIKSEIYKKSMVFTNLNAKSIEAKDLIIGATYVSKQVKNYIYLGHVQWADMSSWSSEASISKQHIFCDTKSNSLTTLLVKDVATCLDTTPVQNIADLITKMESSGHYFTLDKVKIDKIVPCLDEFKKEINLYSGNYHYIGGYNADIFWIKKDETTYEGVKMMFTFPEGANRSYYGYRTSKPNGIKLVYQKKIVITADGVEVKKSSKQDKKIYQPDELKAKEFFDIKLDSSILLLEENRGAYYQDARYRLKTIK